MRRSGICGALALIVAAGLAAPAAGQVVINEVYENPPGSGTVERRYEFLELYGKPNMPLDGYMICVIKGGADPDGDDIPGPIPLGEDLDNDEIYAEIDEAFSLDGLTLGPNGFLILFNDEVMGGIPVNFSEDAAPAATTRRGYSEVHIPSSDTAGSLANDTSSTYVIVFNRPAPNTLRKDVRLDVDFDGKSDFGFELPVVGELDNGTVPGAGTASVVEPYQIVDSVAWSHLGGKEYVRDSDYEISDTPGFNPDAVSRQFFFLENPMLGMRINSMGMTVPTRQADEEWVYGDVFGVVGGFLLDQSRAGAPTDPSGDGFMDVDVTGYTITPGDFNDTVGFTQFRFVGGDLNFDGVLDNADLGFFLANLQGRQFNETEDVLDDMGMPIEDPLLPGTNLQSYVFQDRLAQAYIAMTCLVTDDGVDGANSVDITLQDEMALIGMLGCNPADLNDAASPSPAFPSFGMPDGIITPTDFSAFSFFFSTGDLRADINDAASPSPAFANFGVPDGLLTPTDFSAFAAYFGAGCPCTLPGCP